MPPCEGYKQLLIPIDTFTSHSEAFPTHSEKAIEVVKVFLKEIIPLLGLLQSLQCNNGPSFSSQLRGDKGFWEKLPTIFYIETSVSWKSQENQPDSKASSGKTLQRDI